MTALRRRARAGRHADRSGDMLPPVTGILAASYALKVTLGLGLTFFVLFPLLAHGLLGFAGIVGKGEQAQNDEYEERVTANK